MTHHIDLNPLMRRFETNLFLEVSFHDAPKATTRIRFRLLIKKNELFLYLTIIMSEFY